MWVIFFSLRSRLSTSKCCSWLFLDFNAIEQKVIAPNLAIILSMQVDTIYRGDKQIWSWPPAGDTFRLKMAVANFWATSQRLKKLDLRSDTTTPLIEHRKKKKMVQFFFLVDWCPYDRLWSTILFTEIFHSFWQYRWSTKRKTNTTCWATRVKSRHLDSKTTIGAQTFSMANMTIK